MKRWSTKDAQDTYIRAWKDLTGEDLGTVEEVEDAYARRNAAVYSGMPPLPTDEHKPSPLRPKDLEETLQFLAAVAEVHGERERDRIVECLRWIAAAPKAKAVGK